MVESFDNYQLDFHFLFQSEEMYFIKCFINRRRVIAAASFKILLIYRNGNLLGYFNEFVK